MSGGGLAKARGKRGLEEEEQETQKARGFASGLVGLQGGDQAMPTLKSAAWSWRLVSKE